MPTTTPSLPSVNDIYHHPRGTYYIVTEVTRAKVNYERLFDRKEFHLKPGPFLTKFKPVDQREAAAVMARAEAGEPVLRTAYPMACVNIQVPDWVTLASQSAGLSGGDILNVCVNAMVEASSPENAAEWFIDVDKLNTAIRAVKAAKLANKRPGYQPR
jgi:hypothetical protein